MRRIILEQHAQWHDQWLLFMVARQAPSGGFDYAMMEKNVRLVSLFKNDRGGMALDALMEGGQARPPDAIPYVSFVTMEDADWVALCDKFKQHRWAIFDDDVLALGRKLLNAPEYKPGEEVGDAPGQHLPHAGNGSLPASV